MAEYQCERDTKYLLMDALSHGACSKISETIGSVGGCHIVAFSRMLDKSDHSRDIIPLTVRSTRGRRVSYSTVLYCLMTAARSSRGPPALGSIYARSVLKQLFRKSIK